MSPKNNWGTPFQLRCSEAQCDHSQVPRGGISLTGSLILLEEQRARSVTIFVKVISFLATLGQDIQLIRLGGHDKPRPTNQSLDRPPEFQLFRFSDGDPCLLRPLMQGLRGYNCGDNVQSQKLSDNRIL